MASMKQQLITLAVVLAVMAVTVNAVNLIIGIRQPKDGLVCYGEVNIRAQYGKVVTAQRICNVPRWNQTITQIQALDLGVKGKGGYAQITNGGVRQKTATVYLWSQKSQPLNFTIWIYAKPIW